MVILDCRFVLARSRFSPLTIHQNEEQLGYYLKWTSGHWGLFTRLNIEQRKPTKYGRLVWFNVLCKANFGLRD